MSKEATEIGGHLDQMSEHQKSTHDAVVFIVSQPAQCAECGAGLFKGSMVHLEGSKPLCLRCAVLDSLEFLPSGDVALTRRASKHSARRAAVLEWSHRRKRYERRGILAESEAIRTAEAECRQDAETRARQRERAAGRREVEEREFISSFTEAIQRQFPNCPRAEAREIAAHACAKYSGRVGRTAAAKEFDQEAVRLAVIAHVRHMHTEYDRIIDRLRDKRDARSRIRLSVQEVLREWEQPRTGEPVY
jgi:hypothetical protein